MTLYGSVNVIRSYQDKNCVLMILIVGIDSKDESHAWPLDYCDYHHFDLQLLIKWCPHELIHLWCCLFSISAAQQLCSFILTGRKSVSLKRKPGLKWDDATVGLCCSVSKSPSRCLDWLISRQLLVCGLTSRFVFFSFTLHHAHSATEMGPSTDKKGKGGETDTAGCWRLLCVLEESPFQRAKSKA